MKKYNIGLIRVVSGMSDDLLNLHGKLLEEYFSDFRVVSKAIPDQPEGIHDEQTEMLATPKVIELAKSWSGIDAIIVSCAGDPGVVELRKIIDIPVIGAGESTALLARRYGTKYGVLGLTKELPNSYRTILGENIVGEYHVPGIETTLDLMKQDGRDKVIKQAKRLKDLGAEVIAIACTGMATIKIAKELEGIIDIPVIDPVIAEGTVAHFESLRRS